MQLNMTQRDKNLLVMLSIFVIVVCIGYWGIYPVIKDISDINNEMQTQQDLQSVNELKLAQVLIMEADNETWEKEIQTAREQFYPMMTNAEIDDYFTNMVLDYNLASYELEISSSEEEIALEPYQYSERAALLEQQAGLEQTGLEGQDDAGDVLEQVDNSTAAEGMPVFEDVIMTGICGAQVTMKLGGNEDDLLRLIEDLSNTDKKLRVCSYAWSEERSMGEISEEGEYEIEVSRVLTITLEIYMYQE